MCTGSDECTRREKNLGALEYTYYMRVKRKWKWFLNSRLVLSAAMLCNIIGTHTFTHMYYYIDLKLRRLHQEMGNNNIT